MTEAEEGIAEHKERIAAPTRQSALPLFDAPEPLVTDDVSVEAAPTPAPEAEPLRPVQPSYDPEPLEPHRALVPADFALPDPGPVHAAMRWAYRLGVPASVLCAPLRKPAPVRLLAMVESPLAGDRAAGMQLRAGHLQVGGLKAPLGKLDYKSPSKLTPPFARALHGFTWMRDLSTCAARGQCTDVATQLFNAWLKRNPQPGKGSAWNVETAGQRLLNWLVHAPVLLPGEGTQARRSLLDAIETTARWLDRRVGDADNLLAQVTGWTAITAAGLLLSDGKPRRLYGEAGLLRALGDLVSEDGGVLSRSPSAQAQAIALLVELRACYAAVKRDPPPAIGAMLALLVPALLALRMSDRGLGSWQGGAAMSASALDALVLASGVRARPMLDARDWGYHRVRARDGVLVMDGAPPPKPRHARHGCASTLAFEFSHGAQRIIVNCGGAELAGTLVPARIEQGLRGTSAHSTLTLDEANSTAILLHGQIGKGVEEVDFARDVIERDGMRTTRFEASHNGYAARHGLAHRRVLTLSDSGEDVRGEDLLEPTTAKGKRGKIAFAIRFHLGRGIEAKLTDDARGVHLGMPDGAYWQFRLGAAGDEVQCLVEDSMWVDGHGRPHATQQIVVEGMAARGGDRFVWLLRKMG